ncbi:MAG: glutaredoxin family protein [Undibacterium sp.]|nr:glutaredoxin family protein [Opitutaceae bacterium]
MRAPVTTPVDSRLNSRPVLYTKIDCPWCAEAREVLDRQGIGCDERIVTTDADACAEMMRLSGQAKAPVLDWSGEILADFGAAELEPFLAAKVLASEVRS